MAEIRFEPAYHRRPWEFKWWVWWRNAIVYNWAAWLALFWGWVMDHFQECAGYVETEVNSVPEYEE